MFPHRRFFCAAVSLAAFIALPAIGDETASPTVEQHGKASYYSDKFNRKQTASGAPMNQNELTAASPTLPIGTKAKVTNESTGKSVEVRVNDRGPHKRGRVIDVSKKAANALDMNKNGVAHVRVEARSADQPTSALKSEIAARANRQALMKSQ
jgi:rare lipoprotein A